MVERRSWIPIGDGVRLAASLYLPEAVEAGDAAPVVLEALPYRKDDVTASFRAEYERLCAAYGYAVARADLRGDGVVRGVATDEYPASEQADLCRVIGWLASQSWSTGSVGMYGTSYSGLRCSLESSQTCANVRAREWGSRGQVGEEPVPPSG
jgi:putative CocE/NonD family hydrolase